MTILYLLLPLSLLFVLAIGVSLWWAVFNGQYDDTDSAGTAILRGQPGLGRRRSVSAPRCRRRGLRSAAADMSDPVGSRCF